MAQPTLRLPVHSPFPAPYLLAPPRRPLLRRPVPGRPLAPPRPARSRTGQPARPTGRAAWIATQVAVMVAAVAAYFLVRGATEAKASTALLNAGRLVRLEQALGLDREHWLQHLVLPQHWLSGAFTRFYIYGHWPVIAVTLVLLAVRSPAVFARTRNAMLLSGSVGLAVFLTLPVAPPRLAGLGLVDTVDQQSHAYRVLQPSAFTDQYAAMPSLHVGWNLLMGLALWTATRRWWLRVLAVAGPLMMATTVVVTANHYLLDVAAGVTIATTAWLLAGRLQRRAAAPDRGTERAGVRRPTSVAEPIG